MTIKKRMFIVNSILLILALVVIFGIAAVIISIYGDKTLEMIEENGELSSNAYRVAVMVENLEPEGEEFAEIFAEELRVENFDLFVGKSLDKKNALFNELNKTERECVSQIVNNFQKHQKENEEVNATGSVQLYQMENITIIKKVFILNGEQYFLFACSHNDEHLFMGVDLGLVRRFILIFVFSEIIGIGVLIVYNLFCTRFFIGKILKPVDELSKAALRVKSGNYDEPIDYGIKDEFGEVCEIFNGMQANLKENSERAARYEKARTELVAGISHDLRTPLTSVRGFIKGLKDGVANTPEKREQYLDIAYNKACYMDVLLQKLFYFSKLETGSLPMHRQPVEIGAFIRKTMEEKLLEVKDTISIEITCEAEQEAMADIDVEQFTRVLNNIVDNSIKYGGSDDLAMKVQVFPDEKNVTIRLQDNGKGIEEDKLEHIFEQFYRGDESRNAKVEGSGLGLYICKYIVEKHEGTICAENDNGFAVTITIPRTEAGSVRNGA